MRKMIFAVVASTACVAAFAQDVDSLNDVTIGIENTTDKDKDLDVSSSDVDVSADVSSSDIDVSADVSSSDVDVSADVSSSDVSVDTQEASVSAEDSSDL